MSRAPVRAIVLWLVALVVAVVASTAAVTLATDSVTTLPPVGLASPTEEASPSDAVSTTTPDPAPTPVTPSPSAARSGGSPRPTSDADTAASTSEATPPPTAEPTSPAPSVPDDDDDEDDEGDGDDSGTAVGQQQTASSIGGTARFRFEDGAVSVVFATPNGGFAVDIDDEGDEVRVTFTADDHESRIDADYEDGQPRVRVREDADD